jgi:hypothetical protein
MAEMAARTGAYQFDLFGHEELDGCAPRETAELAN